MKNITKRTLSMLMALVLAASCLSLFSCNNSKTDTKEPGNDPVQEDPYKDNTLPVLEVSTENGRIVSKVVSQSCVVSAKNTEENAFTDLGAKMKGFGDAVWRMTKKTYILNFNEKVNLLGIGSGEANEWILAANHADVSMMRNYLAYTAAKNILTKIPYVTGTAFVSLYINGEYEGVYQVLERVQFDENRLDYTFEAGVNDTNYLIRLDAEADIQIDSVSGTNCFAISSKKYYIENDGMTTEQCTYVSNFYNSMITAVNNGNQAEVEKYLDIDSLVDTYILHEYFKNTDVGNSGFYMVKEKGGKIVFTAPWDFYRSAGNDDCLGEVTSAELCAGNGVTKHDGANPITYRLMRRKWFVDKVVARFNEVKSELAELSSTIDTFYEANKSDLEANVQRWNVIGEKTDKQPQELLDLDSYEAHVDQLKKFVADRHSWMDRYFNSNAVYSQLK